MFTASILAGSAAVFSAVTYTFGVFSALYLVLAIGLLALSAGVIFFLGLYIANIIGCRRAGLYTDRMNEFIEFKDPYLAKTYAKRKMPIRVLLEAYKKDKLDFKIDLYDALCQRQEFSTFELTTIEMKVFFLKFVPVIFTHNVQTDRDAVEIHYEIGHDFFHGFLGDNMTYSCGVVTDASEDIEKMQRNKYELVRKKLKLEKDDYLLDLGCGWGGMARHLARESGCEVLAISTSKEQIEYCQERLNSETAIENPPKFKLYDYREIPRNRKFSKISCIEMSEHVGVLHYQGFLKILDEIMEDNGILFLQYVGLRNSWSWEDFVWGLTSASYVFANADASCPIEWLVAQLAKGGFDTYELKIVTPHYAKTIHKWYVRWSTDEIREKMVAKYGVAWYRIYKFFWAWSTIIATQGSATAVQIVSKKAKRSNIGEVDMTLL